MVLIVLEEIMQRVSHNMMLFLMTTTTMVMIRKAASLSWMYPNRSLLSQSLCGFFAMGLTAAQECERLIKEVTVIPDLLLLSNCKLTDMLTTHNSA